MTAERDSGILVGADSRGFEVRAHAAGPNELEMRLWWGDETGQWSHSPLPSWMEPVASAALREVLTEQAVPQC